MQLINFTPAEISSLTSKQLGEAVAARIAALDGTIELTAIAELVKLNKSLTVALKNENVKAIIEAEYERDGEKTLKVLNGSLNIAQRKSYDYSNVGHPVYNDLIKIREIVDDQIKQHEKRFQLQTEPQEIICQYSWRLEKIESGDVVSTNPPIIKHSNVIKWTI